MATQTITLTLDLNDPLVQTFINELRARDREMAKQFAKYEHDQYTQDDEDHTQDGIYADYRDEGFFVSQHTRKGKFRHESVAQRKVSKNIVKGLYRSQEEHVKTLKGDEISQICHKVSKHLKTK